MRFSARLIVITIAILFSFLSSCVKNQDNNWTHFRGNDLSGISEVKGLPVSWNDSTNIEWKVEIDGRGWSSPVVYGDQIWCTTATPDGKSMYAICNDLKTGEQIFRIKIFEPDTVYRKHAINSYATPTSCIENGFVYVHFGRYGTACINTNSGETVWERTDFQCEHVQGPGSSLLLYKDLLIVHFEGTDIQYIVALDKMSGETVWKSERPQECYEPLDDIAKKAYVTPIIVNVKGKEMLISNGSAVAIAYDPLTGNEIWRIVEGAESTVSMPVVSDGIVYYYTGFELDEEGKRFAELLAVNPDGEGDLTNTNIIWRNRTPPQQLSTPVIKDGLIYTIDSEATMMCLDALTGEVAWSNKLKGKYHSSPISAGGYIYFNSIKGETIVIKEGRNLEIVANNSLDGEIWTTPAIADGSMLIRTSKFLYRIR